MAELLYRIGKLAARRSWTFIVGWALVVALAAAAFVAGFAGLSTSFDIPGTASGDVVAELEEKLPDFGGATGLVVFSTTDGSALTESQQDEISDLAAGAEDLPDVARVVDPFEAQQQRADREQQIADGQAQIDAGRAQLEAGQAQLDAGSAQLDAGQAQLDAARAQAEAAGAGPETLARLDAQQAELDAQRQAIADQQAQLDDSLAELEAQEHTLETGADLLALSEGIQTVSSDGSTAIVNIAFDKPRTELPDTTKHAVIDHFEETPIDGVEVSFSSDLAQGIPQIFGVGEAIGLALAAIVLIVMLGTLLAAALPIITALVGVAVGVLVTLSLSGVVQMASITPVLGVMLGLAVGIDYSLFIVNRHRKQLLEGADVNESIGLANGTAGNAVVFAGSTVVVALLALNVTGIPFLGLMGTAGAFCIVVAVLIAVSLTPALLGLLGARVLSKRDRAKIQPHVPEANERRPMSTARAIVTVVITVIALLIVAIPMLSMRVGLPDGSSEPVESTQYRAYMLTAEKFGAGANGALLVTAELPEGLSDDEILDAQLAVAQTLADQDDVVAVAPIAVSDDGTLAAFQVVPAEGPNSVSTDQLVRDLRALPPVDGDIPLGVAGQAAINIDISENIASVLPLYLVVVVGLSLLILIAVFRSLLVPIIATGGFILSLFATFGALVAVFQWGWLAPVFGITQTGPILSFLPVILVGILFGLAMDYQLFLGTGMREAYVHGSSARVAVAKGFRAGRSVVLAAGLIMVAVFSGFIFSESIMIRSLGFGLAFGVLVDAFIVRMLLMPALMHLFGEAAWWLPKWLDRIIPNIDVEGAALERRHHAVQGGADESEDAGPDTEPEAAPDPGPETRRSRAGRA